MVPTPWFVDVIQLSDQLVFQVRIRWLRRLCGEKQCEVRSDVCDPQATRKWKMQSLCETENEKKKTEIEDSA
jgi:hypothetical protein